MLSTKFSYSEKRGFRMASSDSCRSMSAARCPEGGPKLERELLVYGAPKGEVVIRVCCTQFGTETFPLGSEESKGCSCAQVNGAAHVRVGRSGTEDG